MRVEISNTAGDDFLNSMWTITASESEYRVAWKLHERLINHPQVTEILFQEIAEELRERIDRGNRIKMGSCRWQLPDYINNCSGARADLGDDE